MFGSLVVALPTKHEGGTFPLRHNGREWVFNSAELVSPQNTESPRAAFIAFYGDMEHEVTEVKSGYRVTLTYNLYFGDDKSTIVPSSSPAKFLPIDDTEIKIKNLLKAMLNKPDFLPNGGLVGFALSHLYPLNSDEINLLELRKNLKGTDAAIKRACDSLSLNVSLKTVYNCEDEPGVACLLDGIAETYLLDVDGIFRYLQEDLGGLLVIDNRYIGKKFPGFEYADPILWLRPVTERHQLETAYVAYGNEATLNYIYGEVCLVIMVKAYKDRKVY